MQQPYLRLHLSKVKTGTVVNAPLSHELKMLFLTGSGCTSFPLIA